MDYRPPADMDDVDLVALVLGKKQADEECLALADLIVTDGVLAVGPLLEVTQGTKVSAVNRIMKIQAAIELGRRSLAMRSNQESIYIHNPFDVYNLMASVFLGIEKEHFYVLCLNIKQKLIRLELVSVGNLNASIVHPRELFKPAIGLSSASVVVTHNHPSGDSTPSGADISLTQRLVQAGDVLGISVVDHIIVGSGGDYTSLQDAGVM